MAAVTYSQHGPAQLLIDALQDPFNPTRCSRSLLAAFPSILESHKPTTYDEWRRQSTLYKTLYQFLVVKRPLGQLKQWMERFSTCEYCNEPEKYKDPRRTTTKIMHERWDRLKDKVMSDYHLVCSTVARMDKEAMYPAASCSFVLGAMRVVEPALRRARTKSFVLGTFKAWPTSIDCIMPFGPDQLTESLLQWYTVYPEPPLINFFTTVMLLTGSILYPSICKYQFINITVNSMKQFLDVALDVFDGVSRVGSKEVASFLHMFDYMASTFVLVFGHTLDALPHIRVLLIGGCEVKALQTLSLLVVTLPLLKASPKYRQSTAQLLLDNFNDRIEGLLLCSSKMYRCLHMDKYSPPTPDIPLAQPIVNWDMRMYFGSHDGFEAELGLALLWLSSASDLSYGCFAKAHGCTESFESAGKEFKCCKGCLGVYYCGTECQTKEWNDGDYPHKRICRILSKVIPAQHAYLKQMNTNFKRHSYVVRIGDNDQLPELVKVQTIREIIRMGNLSPEETAILKGWGQRIYDMHRIEVPKWQPGFEDYDAIVQRLSIPKGKSKYNSKFAYMNKTPSEETQRQKALLVVSPKQIDTQTR